MEKNTCMIELDNSNKEINQQGSVQLPLAIYNDNLTQTPVPYHWHDELELIVVTKGEMQIVIELEKYILKQGEGIFVNASRLHSCTNYNHSECLIQSIVFHPRFIYGELSSTMYEKYFYPLIQEGNYDMVMLDKNECLSVVEAHNMFRNEDFGCEFLVREKLLKAIFNILYKTNGKASIINPKKNKQIQRCKAMMFFIHQNYDKDITLETIASSGNIKESECLRCFKAVLDISPIKYLKKYRLQQAASMLLTTSKTIIDIGMSCGFTEMSYFSKSFKEIYKITPSEYRKVGNR